MTSNLKLPTGLSGSSALMTKVPDSDTGNPRPPCLDEIFAKLGLDERDKTMWSGKLNSRFSSSLFMNSVDTEEVSGVLGNEEANCILDVDAYLKSTYSAAANTISRNAKTKLARGELIVNRDGNLVDTNGSPLSAVSRQRERFNSRRKLRGLSPSCRQVKIAEFGEDCIFSASYDTADLNFPSVDSTAQLSHTGHEGESNCISISSLSPSKSIVSLSNLEAGRYFGLRGCEEFYNQYRALSREKSSFNGTESSQKLLDGEILSRFSSSPPRSAATISSDKAYSPLQNRSPESNVAKPSLSENFSAESIGTADSNHVEDVFGDLDASLVAQSLRHYYSRPHNNPSRPSSQQHNSSNVMGSSHFGIHHSSLSLSAPLSRPHTVAATVVITPLKERIAGRRPRNHSPETRMTSSLPPLKLSAGLSPDSHREQRSARSVKEPPKTVRSNNSKQSSAVASPTKGSVRHPKIAMAPEMQTLGIEVPDVDPNAEYSPRTRYVGACLQQGLTPLPSMLVRRELSTTLQLEGKGIGDRMASIVARCLVDLPHVEAVNVADNGLHPCSLLPLTRALQQMPQLLRLDLSNNSLDARVVDTIAAALSVHSCLLEQLRLCAVGMDDADCEVLIAAMTKNERSRIRLLDFGANKMGMSSDHHHSIKQASLASQRLAELLKAPHCQLESLMLPSNLLADASMLKLCNGIAARPSLAFLDLSYNALGSVAGEALGDALSAAGDSCMLRTLVLVGTNLTSTAVLSLCAWLMHNSTARSVRLDDNPIGEGGAFALLLLTLLVRRPIDLSVKGCSASKPLAFDAPFKNLIHPEEICRTHKFDLAQPAHRAAAIMILSIVASHKHFNIKTASLSEKPLSLICSFEQLMDRTAEEATNAEQKQQQQQNPFRNTTNTASDLVNSDSISFLDGLAVATDSDPFGSEVKQLQALLKVCDDLPLCRRSFLRYASNDGESAFVPIDNVHRVLEALGGDTVATSLKDFFCLSQVDIDLTGKVYMDEFLAVVEHVAAELRQRKEDLCRSHFVGLASKPHEKFVVPRKGAFEVHVVLDHCKEAPYQIVSTAELEASRCLAQQLGYPAMLIDALRYSALRLNEGLTCYRILYSACGDKAASLVKILPLMDSTHEARLLVARVAGSATAPPTAGLGLATASAENSGLADLQLFKLATGALLGPLQGMWDGFFSLDLSREGDRKCLEILRQHAVASTVVHSSRQTPSLAGSTTNRGTRRRSRLSISSKGGAAARVRNKAVAGIHGQPAHTPTDADPLFTPPEPFACFRNCTLDDKHFQLALEGKLRGKLVFDFTSPVRFGRHGGRRQFSGSNFDSTPCPTIASDQRIVNMLVSVGMLSDSSAAQALVQLREWSLIAPIPHEELFALTAGTKGQRDASVKVQDQVKVASFTEVVLAVWIKAAKEKEDEARAEALAATQLPLDDPRMRRALDVSTAKKSFICDLVKRCSQLACANMKESLCEYFAGDALMLVEDSYFGGFAGWTAQRYKALKDTMEIIKAFTGQVENRDSAQKEGAQVEGTTASPVPTLPMEKTRNSDSSTMDNGVVFEGAGSKDEETTARSASSQSLGAQEKRALLKVMSSVNSFHGSNLKLKLGLRLGMDKSVRSKEVKAALSSSRSITARSNSSASSRWPQMRQRSSAAVKASSPGTASPIGNHRSPSGNQLSKQFSSAARQIEEWRTELKEKTAALMDADYDPSPKAARMTELIISLLFCVRLSSRQLALIVQCLNVFGPPQVAAKTFGSYSVQLVVALFGQLVDPHNIEIVMRSLSARDAAAVECRLGLLSLFSPLRPSGVHILDLHHPEERLVLKALLLLSLIEGAHLRDTGACCARISNFTFAHVHGEDNEIVDGAADKIPKTDRRKENDSARGGTSTSRSKRSRATNVTNMGHFSRPGPMGEIPASWYTAMGLPSRGSVTLIYPSPSDDDGLVTGCRVSISARLALFRLISPTANESLKTIEGESRTAEGTRISFPQELKMALPATTIYGTILAQLVANEVGIASLAEEVSVVWKEFFAVDRV